jgi:quercetin dioxygenase-like cupin family protein
MRMLAFCTLRYASLRMHVLQGTVTVHSKDGSTKEVKAGESSSGGKGITHWAENKGTENAIVISVDIFPGE